MEKRLAVATDAPIGVFDSGVGGLSVLRHVRKALPQEDLLYVADSAHAPYGSKTPEQIRQRAHLLAQFLVEQGAKALVIACNTATAAAASQLRDSFEIPIIGMEPAVKPAVAATRSGVVGVLATSGTLQSARFAALLETYGQGVQVVTQAAHGLVECVERGELDGLRTHSLLNQYLQPLLDAGADTIVLGCTHYPFLRSAIEKIVGHQIAIIDTGSAVARHLSNRLVDVQLVRAQGHIGVERFWTSGNTAEGQVTVAKLWGAPQVVLAPFER